MKSVIIKLISIISVSAIIFLLRSKIILKYNAIIPEPTVYVYNDKNYCNLQSPVTEKSSNVHYVTLTFLGDCMLASMLGESGFNTFNKLADIEQPEYFFMNFTDIFKNDTLTFANCENVFTDNNELLPVIKNHSPAYWYKSKTQNAGIFKAGNIDVVSIANNHISDYGAEGRTDTINALESNDIIWSDHNKPLIFDIKGFKIAVLCTEMNSSGNISHIIPWIEKIKDISDYKIIYYHGGTELSHVPDEGRVRASHTLIDYGADLVIGHHPHVLQPMEIYNGSVIIHSLGNFLFGGGRPENRSVIFQQILLITDNVITDIENNIIPIYNYVSDYQPAIIENEAVKQRVIDFMNGLADSPV